MYKILFVQNENNKWVWKRYDEKGRVVYISIEFDSEKEAKEDYDNFFN